MTKRQRIAARTNTQRTKFHLLCAAFVVIATPALAQRRERTIASFADLSSAIKVTGTNQGAVEVWAVGGSDRVLLRAPSATARLWVKGPADSLYAVTTKAGRGEKATDTSEPLAGVTDETLELMRTVDASGIHFYAYASDRYRVNTVMVALAKTDVRRLIDAIKRAAAVTDSMTTEKTRDPLVALLAPHTANGPSATEQLLQASVGKVIDLTVGEEKQTVTLVSVGFTSFTVSSDRGRWSTYDFSRISSAKKDSTTGTVTFVIR